MQLAVLYVVSLAAAAVSGQDVVMILSYEGSKNFMIDFKLTSVVFKSFYQCLCTGATSSCHLPYDYTHTIQSVRPDTTATDYTESPCKLYTCANSGQSTSVVCTSLGQADDTCARQVTPTFVSLVDSASSCSASCVGIAWNLNNENLTFNDHQLQVRGCGSQCCSGLASVEPPQHNESSYEHVWVQETVNQDGYTDTYIVAGIGGGVFLIAIVVFIIFLLLTSRTGSSLRQREVTNITQGSTNGTNHSFYPNNVIIHTTPELTSDAGKDTNKKIQPANPFAGFGLTKAKDTNHLKNKDTNDKPGHSKLDNQRQASGNRLSNRKSNKSDGHNDNASDDSADYSDYAEIDECQIQDPDQFEYIPDSSETGPNDGYSTVDNSDYYNINDVTPGSADSNSSEHRERSEDVLTSKGASINKAIGQGLQTTTHKNFNTPLPARNVSEYSVAAAIGDGASTYSMGQQMDEPSRDQRFPLDQERDNASDNDSGDRKRNSYFILEKETDEQDI